MLTIAEHVAWIATRLCAAIGALVAEQARPPATIWLGTQPYLPIVPPPSHPPLPAALWVAFARRLERLQHHFQTLFDRWRANRLPARRPPRLRPRATPSTPPPRLPRAHGWANHRVPGAALCAGRIDFLLADPDCRALVEAAPQAGRLLRPLCHALGQTLPPWLRLPPRPRRPAPAVPSPIPSSVGAPAAPPFPRPAAAPAIPGFSTPA